MKERQFDKLFERFRARGDVGALGKVFDGTAPELMRVAMSLVSDATDADDLLQSTYLTAIERADRYDGGRRLVPWLLGILVRHAHEKRRERARVGGGERLGEQLGERSAPDPASVLESREIADSLHAALGQLRARDREVLEPFLREGLTPAEIAVRHGRAPGTVRMQIHRGLERLRKALPAGLATGAAALLGEHGLAQVRASVLSAGERAATSLAGGAGRAGGATLPGPVFLGTATHKLVLPAVSLTALVGLSLVLWKDSLRTPTEDLRLVEGSESGASAELSSVPSVAEGSPRADAAAQSSAREAIAQGNEEPDPLAEFLIGMNGRLLDLEGRGLPNVPVQLLEFRATFLGTSNSSLEENPGHFRVDRTVTDEEGRFDLRGARARALHILAIDPEGPLAQWRLAGRGAGPGARVALGDFHLSEPLRVRGRVVDPSGRGVAGARVRAGLLENELARADFARYGPDKAFVLTSEPATFVVLPRLFSELLDSYPLSHGKTEADGTFELAIPRRRSEDEISVIADHDRHGLVQRVVLQSFMEETGELSAPLVFPRRALVTVSVREGNEPIVGAEVWASDRDFAPEAAVSVGEKGHTDLSGEMSFETMDGVEHIVAVRRDATQPWTLARFEGTQHEIVLAPQRSLEVSVVDSAGGPVEEVRFALRDWPFPGVDLLRERTTLDVEEVDELEPGRYRLSGLADELFVLVGRAPGFVAGAIQVDGIASNSPMELELVRALPQSLRIVDAQTERAILGARVLALGTDVFSPVLAAGESDADGGVSLEGIAEGSAYRLRVGHPGYATLHLGVESAALPEILYMDRGGSLEVSLSGEDPAQWLFDLRTADPDHVYVDHGTGEISAFAEEGLTFSHLAPGLYRYRFMRRPGQAPRPLEIMFGSGEIVEEGEVWVRRGKTAFVELSREQEPQVHGTGRFEGVVRIDGLPAEGAQVTAALMGAPAATQRTRVAANGSFEFNLEPGNYHVSVCELDPVRNQPKLLPLYVEWLELGLSEVVVREYTWSTSSIDVHIENPDGSVGVGVYVQLHPLRLEGVTDPRLPSGHAAAEANEEGVAHLRTLAVGDYMLNAATPRGAISREITVRSGHANDPVHVRLGVGEPCAGRIRADLPDGSKRSLTLFHEASGLSQSTLVRFVEGEAEFRLVGLAAETYEVWMHGKENELRYPSLELPLGGAEDLLLEPEAPRDLGKQALQVGAGH